MWGERFWRHEHNVADARKTERERAREATNAFWCQIMPGTFTMKVKLACLFHHSPLDLMELGGASDCFKQGI